MKLNTKSIIAMTALCTQMFATDAKAQIMTDSNMPKLDSIYTQVPSYWDNKERWSNGPVSLHRFEGGKTKHDSITAVVRYSFLYKLKKENIDGIHYQYDNYEAAIDYDFCQLNPKYKDDEHVQKYAQVIMNIAEKYARIKTADRASSDIWEYPHHNYHETRAQAAVDLFNELTNYGKDTAEVNTYYEKSVRELKDILHPAQYAANFREKGGWDWYWGLLSNFPQGGGLCNTYGLDFGFHYHFDSRFFLGTELQFSFGGGCHGDIVTSERNIEKGEGVNNGKAMLTFGAKALKTRSISIAPILRLGVEDYAFPDQSKKANKKDYSPSITALTYGTGIAIDIPLWRSVRLDEGWYGKRNCYRGIRITPSVSLSDFGNGVGRITTYNLTVSYYGITRWLHDQ